VFWGFLDRKALEKAESVPRKVTTGNKGGAKGFQPRTENMFDLYATECPANCRSCEDTKSGTRCKVDGCDEGYAYKADDGTCQR